jgi:hypothetical protein
MKANYDKAIEKGADGSKLDGYTIYCGPLSDACSKQSALGQYIIVDPDATNNLECGLPSLGQLFLHEFGHALYPNCTLPGKQCEMAAHNFANCISPYKQITKDVLSEDGIYVGTPYQVPGFTCSN